MKETLRRLSVVIVWLATIICCFLVYSINADWWFYLMWCCFGIVGHNVVNWIFQKDSEGGKFGWESFGEAILKVTDVHWGLTFGLGVLFFLTIGIRSETFTELLIEYDMAKISGHLTGRVIASCLIGYIVGVIINVIIMILSSSFVRKIFGG